MNSPNRAMSREEVIRTHTTAQCDPRDWAGEGDTRWDVYLFNMYTGYVVAHKVAKSYRGAMRMMMNHRSYDHGSA